MVEEIGAAKLFDFFVLCDSRAELEDRERAAFQKTRLASAVPVYYRRRRKNVAR